MSLDPDDLLWLGAAEPGAQAAAGAAAEAGAIAREARTELLELRADVDRLFAISQTLWDLLRTEHGYDDATLRQKVAEFERAARAKRVEGAELPQCAQCGRPVARHRSSCMYCGMASVPDPFAR